MPRRAPRLRAATSSLWLYPQDLYTKSASCFALQATQDKYAHFAPWPTGAVFAPVGRSPEPPPHIAVKLAQHRSHVLRPAWRYAARKGDVRDFSHCGLRQVRGGFASFFASAGGCPKGRMAIQHGNDSKSKPKVQELNKPLPHCR